MVNPSVKMFLAGALGLGLSPLVVAQSTSPGDNQPTPEIEQIIVLGVRNDNFNVAVTDTFIDDRQINDLEGMFRHEPSITVGGGLPVAQKVYVRGLEDTQLNVTIDGATQSGYLYHHQGRINLEPELIKDVVIEAGAGRATAGPGALGGAIHFRTIDALDMLEGNQNFGALVKGTYNDVNEGEKYHASLFGRINEDFGWLASYTQYETDNYEDGNGNEVAQSAVEQESLLLKLSGNIAPDHYLSVSYEDRSDNGIRFARPNMVALPHPIYPSTPVPQTTERVSWASNYRFNPSSELIDLNATLYRTENEITKQGDLWRDFSQPPPAPPLFSDFYNGRPHGGGVESLGLNVGNKSLLGTTTLEYGLEWRTDSVYLINRAVTSFDDEETDVSAIYLQSDIPLTDVVTLSVGARYDDYDYTDNQGVNFSDTGFSPNTTISFSPIDELKLHIGYAQAFKGVSSPEVFFLENPAAGATLTNYVGPSISSGDFTLGTVAAEESENIEVGFRYQNGAFMASGEIFQQDIENAQVTGSSQRHSYQDLVEADGYALRLGYAWEALYFNVGVSETEPTLNDEPLSSGDMGLGTAYGRTWNAGLEYSFSSIDLRIGWNLRSVEDLDFVRTGQDEKDGYTVQDIYANWQITQQAKLGLAVSNLTDRFYYDQGTFFTQGVGGDVLGLPEPGRDIKLNLTVNL